MKLFGKTLSCAATCLFGAGSLDAAVVTWQTPVTMSDGNDINLQGATVFARSQNVAFGGGTSIINGVDFGYGNTGWSITYAQAGLSSVFGNGVTGTGNYATVMGGTSYAVSGTATITLGNLVNGNRYLFQFWVADYRGFPDDRTEVVSAGGSDINIPTLKFLDSDGTNITAGNSSETAAAAHGQYVIGTFTADSNSITFSFSGGAGPNNTAIQLRDITAVPEPSTYGLLGACALAVVAGVRRRRRKITAGIA